MSLSFGAMGLGRGPGRFLLGGEVLLGQLGDGGDHQARRSLGRKRAGRSRRRGRPSSGTVAAMAPVVAVPSSRANACSTCATLSPQAAQARKRWRGWRPPASFKGMRRDLAQWLDDLGLAAVLGLRSCSELFEDSHRALLHTTSAVRYPVFVRGRDGSLTNYSGSSPEFVAHPWLRGWSRPRWRASWQRFLQQSWSRSAARPAP